MEFIFRLSFQLPQDDVLPEEFMERLARAGCDDALVGMGRPGRIGFEFCREAQSALNGFSTAIADVKRAIPNARLIEASPDLVGLTDIADVVGISRQAMRKMVLANVSTFPIPVHDGNVALWHLSDVLGWMAARGTSYAITSADVDVARAAKQLNLARQASQLDPGFLQSIQELVA